MSDQCHPSFNPTCDLLIVREFNAPRALVWAAWTETRHIEKWFGPRGFSTRVTENNLTPGGRTRFVMIGPDGQEYPCRGQVLEVVPLEKIVSTDEFDEGFEARGIDLPQGMIATVQFEDLPRQRTRVTIKVSHPTPEERQKHEAMGVVAGWQSSLDCLDEHLAALRTQSAAKIFVNLPVRDLSRSIAFFEALGYACNPQFTNDQAACLVISDTIYFMLLTHPFFKGFLTKPMVDATQATEVLLALYCSSREDVDSMVSKAVAAGATTPRQPQDHGFMYQHGFDDLDGHAWEVFWMDPNFVQQS